MRGGRLARVARYAALFLCGAFLVAIGPLVVILCMVGALLHRRNAGPCGTAALGGESAIDLSRYSDQQIVGALKSLGLHVVSAEGVQAPCVALPDGRPQPTAPAAGREGGNSLGGRPVPYDRMAEIITAGMDEHVGEFVRRHREAVLGWVDLTDRQVLTTAAQGGLMLDAFSIIWCLGMQRALCLLDEPVTVLEEPGEDDPSRGRLGHRNGGEPC